MSFPIESAFAPDIPGARPTAHIQRLGKGRTAARISGRLPEDWLLRLSRGCATRGFSLLEGWAERVRGERWRSELVVDLRSERTPVPNFIELARAERPLVQPPEARILDFELLTALRPDGALEVEVHAWESVGLLAGVLARVDRAGLVAEELRLETEADCAFHNIAVRGDDGAPATPRQRRVLARGLKDLLGG